MSPSAPETPPPGSAGPLDIAMAAAAADPSLHHPARTLLDEQTRLVREQIGLARNERFRNRIRAIRDAAFSTLALFAVGVVAWLIWDASRADGLVIRPIVAPAGSGLDGAALSARLLDRLARMQAATASARPGRSASDGAGEIEVQIPSTGVSLNEVLQLMRRRLGNETVVTGELLRSDDGGYALSLRVDGRPVEAVTPMIVANGPPAPPATLDTALDRGAEGVFAAADGYRYTQWLALQNRREESSARLRRLALRGPVTERAWALSGLSVDLRTAGRHAESIAAAQEALRLNPGLSPAWANVALAQERLGHEETALFALRRAVAVATRDERAEDRIQNAVRVQGLALALGDTQTAEGAADVVAANLTTDAQATASARTRAVIAAVRHDLRQAIRWMNFGTPNAQGLTMPQRTSLVQALAAAEGETLDPQLFDRLLLEPWPASTPVQFAGVENLRRRLPWLAWLRARQGRHADAQRLIAMTPADCLLCVTMRGRVAAMAGRHSEAEQAFAQAVTMAPSLPQPLLAQARARLDRGDAAGALPLLRLARRLGPAWADPIRYEADALARTGQLDAALSAYAQAERLAPRWAGLHAAWAEALARSERASEAAVHRRLAESLALRPDETAELVRLLAPPPATPAATGAVARPR